jgi:hypothetical protein
LLAVDDLDEVAACDGARERIEGVDFAVAPVPVGQHVVELNADRDINVGVIDGRQSSGLVEISDPRIADVEFS